MQNYSIYRIAETIRVLIFITSSIIIFKFHPTTALMIVLLAVLNDIPIMSIAYDNVKISDKPEKWNMRRILGIATMLGITGVFFTFGMLTLGLAYFQLSQLLIQSLIYLKLSLAANMTVFMARTRGHFWSIRSANILLLACALCNCLPSPSPQQEFFLSDKILIPKPIVVCQINHIPAHPQEPERLRVIPQTDGIGDPHIIRYH
jgi:magnesium-transporting ATPase (P-type)